MDDWTPRAVGEDFELPFILEPLKVDRQELLVLSGLAHDNGRPHGDGAGDHARASATFLTGCKARETPGADIKAGRSVEQVAAQQNGEQPRLPPLELGTAIAPSAGQCAP